MDAFVDRLDSLHWMLLVMNWTQLKLMLLL